LAERHKNGGKNEEGKRQARKDGVELDHEEKENQAETMLRKDSWGCDSVVESLPEFHL
jgi:hypothetical protein